MISIFKSPLHIIAPGTFSPKMPTFPINTLFLPSSMLMSLDSLQSADEGVSSPLAVTLKSLVYSECHAQQSKGEAPTWGTSFAVVDSYVITITDKYVETSQGVN